MLWNSNVTDFILLGLTQDPMKRKIIFVIFLFVCLGTLCGILLIIVTIKTSRTLGSSMYFFLFYLSLIDTCLSTSTAPRMFIDAILTNLTISFNECMVQVFSFHVFASLEILILILTALDCCVAICKPLHYTTITSWWVCSVLMTIACMLSCIHASIQNSLVLSLPFCGPNVIDHYFCDLEPLLNLACSDTYNVNLLLVSNSGVICTAGVILLMFSYTTILYSLRNHSAEGRKKALSTYISHIIVVILHFGPCIFIYSRPATTFPIDKMISVFYTIGTLLFNPLIYTLRNAEVKKCHEEDMEQETDLRVPKMNGSFKSFFRVWIDLTEFNR
ncbi:olfactory receptor 4C16-like [Orycteropus afer afer]|uniref:Olfactory receptor 4C16-like n=1 Tax=Orycteropus afer afer TaxID=1230840 RepID=A0AC54Z732_ORYAF|nr:olfactory receptor 4C16-like [Orycteropus afer afer]